MNFSPKNIIFSIVSASIGIIVFSICVLFVFNVGNRAYSFGYNIFNEKPMSEGLGHSVLVEVKKGMTDDAIAKLMFESGLVEDQNVFFVQIKLSEYSKKYVPGKYMLNTNMTPTELLAKICSGETYLPLETVTENNVESTIEEVTQEAVPES